MTDVKVTGHRRRFPRPRTIVTLVIVIVLVVVVWTQRDTVVSIIEAISEGAVIPLIVAAAFEMGRISLHGLAYTRSYKTIGYNVSPRKTIPAWFKSVFMNTILPSGGATGMATVVDAGRSVGVPVGSGTSAVLFTQTCFYLAELLAIIVGFIVMANSGSLEAREVVMGLLLGLLALAFLALLALGYYIPGQLQRFMRMIERFVVRVLTRFHIKKMPKPWADSLVHSFSSAATELSRHPRRALTVFLCMVAAIACDAFAFIFAGVAFGITRPDALFGGYATALVFQSITITPGGVGFVEGLASAMLVSYGYPLNVSLSTVLIYRALVYFIPFVVGGIMMHVTGAFGFGSKKTDETPAEQTEGAQAAEESGSVAGGVAAAAASTEAAGAASASPDLVEKEPVYVRRRRNDRPLRERIVLFIDTHLDLRTVICLALVVVTAVVGLIAAALPADAFMTDTITNFVLGQNPLTPTAMVVCSYLLLLLIPGLILHDQGNWLVTLIALLALAFSTALSGHSVWATIAALVSLIFLVVWRGRFIDHGYFNSRVRLAKVVVYSVCILVLYALIGSLFARGYIDPEPGIASSLWMGIQAIVMTPHAAGAVMGEAALWFFGSVRAMTITLVIAIIYVIAFIGLQRLVADRQPGVREARLAAREEAEAAAAERREERKEQLQERLRTLRIVRIRQRPSDDDTKIITTVDTIEITETAEPDETDASIGPDEADEEDILLEPDEIEIPNGPDEVDGPVEPDVIDNDDAEERY